MKSLLHIPVFLFAGLCLAQEGLYNSGNFQVHGNMGVHTHFINEGVFDQTQGLVGFYGPQTTHISGAIPPTFWDMEVLKDSELYLFIPANVRNNLNFVDGDIATPPSIPTTYLNFMDQGFFTGEGNTSKITGFAAVNNRTVFSFPVGDEDQLRPLTFDTESPAPLAVCAYFFEDPSDAMSIGEQFNVNNKVRNIGTVSDKEFWILQSDVPTQVTLSWNTRSALGEIANATAESIIVVGWSKASRQWVDIGSTAFSGDITQGFVTSETFVPSEFSAITFGTVPLPTDTFAVNNPTLGNYFLSPNGDGTNDFLVIDGLEESPNNKVSIFNRYGQKVFEKINYVNEFQGISNTGSFIMNQDIGLPEGVYFYIAILDDLELEYTGFLFLDR